MTEEQKAALRAKDAVRKRKSRANKSEDQIAAERSVSEEMRAGNQKKTQVHDKMLDPSY